MINNQSTFSQVEPILSSKQIKEKRMSYSLYHKQQSVKSIQSKGNYDNMSQAQSLSNAENHVKNFINTVLAEIDSETELKCNLRPNSRRQPKVKDERNDTVQSSLHLTKSSGEISSCDYREITDTPGVESSKRKMLVKKKSEIKTNECNTPKIRMASTPNSAGTLAKRINDPKGIQKSFQKYNSMGQYSKFFKPKLNDSGIEIELDNSTSNNKTVIEPSSIRNHNKKKTTHQFTNLKLSNGNLNKYDFENEHPMNKHLFNSVKNQPHHEIEIENMKGLTKSNMIELKRICQELKDNICSSNNNPMLHAEITKTETKTYQSDGETETCLSHQLTVKCGKEIKYRRIMRKGCVYDSLDDEECDDEIDVMFCLKPSSPFVIIFDSIIVLIVLSSLTYTPVSLAFNYSFSVPYSQSELIYEFFFDIIMILDVILRFFRAYYINDDVLMAQINRIAKKYLFSWFFPDLITAIPVTSFIMKKHNNDLYQNRLFFFEYYMSKKITQMIRFVRMFKIINVLYMNSFVTIAKNYLLHIHHFNQYSRLYMSIFVFFITVHILSSLFIFIGKLNYPCWISAKHEDISSSAIYIHSLYFILSSIYSVGYGDIVSVSISERIFNLFLLVFGVMIYSWGLSSISSYVQTKNAQKLEYQNQCKILDDIKHTHHKMSFELYDKVGRFLYYRMHAEKNDKGTIIDSLPIGLRNNLIWEMYKPIIENFTFFNSFNHTDFIVRIILAFKPIVGLKNDVLVKEGEFMEEMIFVKRGNLTLQLPLPNLSELSQRKITGVQKLNHLNSRQKESLLNLEGIPNSHEQLSFAYNSGYRYTEENEIELKQYVKILELRSNEHFGDVLMFLNKRSPLTMKVKSKIVEMFYLKKTDAVDISSSYPDIWDQINEKSIFNMEQIERLINKAKKLFYKSNQRLLDELMKETRKRNSLYAFPHIESRKTKMIKELFEIVVNESSYDLMSIPSKNTGNENSRSYITQEEDNKIIIKGDRDEESSKKSKDSSFENELYNHYAKTKAKIINEIIEEQDSEQTIELKIEDEKQLISTTTSVTNKPSQTELTHLSFDNQHKSTVTLQKKHNLIIQASSSYEINSNTSFTIKSSYDNLHTYNNYDIEKTVQLAKLIIKFNREELLSCLTKKLTELQLKRLNDPTIHYSNNKEYQTIIRSNSLDSKKSNNIQIRKCMTKTIFDEDSNKEDINLFNQKEISKQKFNHLRANFFRVKTNVSEEVSRGKVKKVMSPKAGGNRIQHRNTLFKINNNIKMNAFNLNNPDVFYSEYFQSIIHKEQDIKEQQMLIKRLEKTENIIADKCASFSSSLSSYENEGKRSSSQNYIKKITAENHLNSNKKLKNKDK